MLRFLLNHALKGIMLEIVVEGRGGQGAVTGAQIIAEAAFLRANSLMFLVSHFGVERQALPLKAHTNFGTKFGQRHRFAIRML